MPVLNLDELKWQKVTDKNAEDWLVDEDENGLLALSCFLKIFSLMLSPDDEIVRQKCQAQLAGQVLTACQDETIDYGKKKKPPAGVSGGEWKGLIGKSFKYVTKPIIKAIDDAGGIRILSLSTTSSGNDEIYSENYKEGCVAGDVLRVMWLLNEGELVSSVNRAVFIVGNLKNKIVAGKKNNLKAWSKFKSVSHFWCAYTLVSSMLNEGEPIFPSSKIELFTFLNVVIYFYSFGTSHYSRGQKQSVLVENETWTFPDGFPVFEDLIFDFRPNNEHEINEILEVYKNYKA